MSYEEGALERKIEEIEEKDVISHEEYELLEEHESLPEYFIKSKEFNCPCGQHYSVSVFLMEDGESPDENNTWIYIIKESEGDKLTRE